MLTSEQIERITVEAVMGIKSSIKGKEAREFRKKIEENVEGIRAKGGQVEIESDNP